jgi:hypothetical protein
LQGLFTIISLAGDFGVKKTEVQELDQTCSVSSVESQEALTRCNLLYCVKYTSVLVSTLSKRGGISDQDRHTEQREKIQINCVDEIYQL